MKPANASRRPLSVSRLIGARVRNQAGDDLGTIEDVMLDTAEGKVGYAVLSFGGFLGMGDKLFAIPWAALSLDRQNKILLLNADREVFERAPGLDKDHWPDMEDAWEDQSLG